MADDRPLHAEEEVESEPVRICQVARECGLIQADFAHQI